MATIPLQPVRRRSEERFFFTMACLMAAVLVAGFGLNVALGRSSFASPLIVHVHAFVFFGWVVLYVLQNALILTGNHRYHRQLGWLALLWIPAMVVLGTVMTVYSLRTTGGPFFFDQNEFLFGNPLGILAFAGLAGWAIAVRANTGWHRRLMFCAMAVLTGPGFGRLLPMPLLMPWAWWVSNVVPLLFPLVGMWADRRRAGRVHPAWAWGVGVILLTLIVIDLSAYSPAGKALTEWVLAGSPGGERPMAAAFPS
jgi:hypothetical protein